MAVRTISTQYKWKIDNFNQRISAIEAGGLIFSDVFSLNVQSKANFLMKLQYQTSDRCSAYLIYNNFEKNQEIKFKVKIWRENTKGSVGPAEEKNLIFNRTSTIGPHISSYGINAMKGYAANGDVLFICCEIQYEDEKEDNKEELVMRSELGKTMLEIHSEGHFDLTIQAGGKEFKASKLNFMACSDVFRRMFSCPNSIEAKTGILKIENIKPEVIDALIHWIYGVEVESMEDIIVDLYEVADKYVIDPLKKKCVRLMIKSLSKENVAPHLILAYQHNEDKLKQHIIEFLEENNTNLKDLIASDEWFKLGNEGSEEAKNILDDIFNDLALLKSC